MLHQGTAPQLADVADHFGSATSTYFDDCARLRRLGGTAASLLVACRRRRHRRCRCCLHVRHPIWLDEPSRHRASRTKALTTACTEHARVTATDRGKNGMARDAHRCGAICHEFLGTPAPCSALRKHPQRTRARFPHGLTARRVCRHVAHVLCAEEAALSRSRAARRR